MAGWCWWSEKEKLFSTQSLDQSFQLRGIPLNPLSISLSLIKDLYLFQAWLVRA